MDMFRRMIRKIPRAWGPLLLGGVVYLALLGGWRNIVQPLLPEEAPINADMGFEIAPGTSSIRPIMARGDPESAGLLMLGDSRAIPSIYPYMFEERGAQPPTLIWSAGGQLLDLIPVARKYRARRIIIALSPGSVYRKLPAVFEAIANQKLPSLSSLSPRQQRAAARAWLLKLAAPFQTSRLVREEALVDRLLTFLAQVPEGTRVGQVYSELSAALRPPQGFSTKKIDEQLGRWLDAKRERWIRTIFTQTWQHSWFPPLDPDQSNQAYRAGLGPATRDQRNENFMRLEQLLGELHQEGWEVVCTRLPISPALLIIEEEAFPVVKFQRLCQRLSVPFLDYSAGPYLTRDGSHLTATSGMRFCRQFIADLAAATGWW